MGILTLPFSVGLGVPSRGFGFACGHRSHVSTDRKVKWRRSKCYLWDPQRCAEGTPAFLGPDNVHTKPTPTPGKARPLGAERAWVGECLLTASGGYRLTVFACWGSRWFSERLAWTPSHIPSSENNSILIYFSLSMFSYFSKCSVLCTFNHMSFKAGWFYFIKLACSNLFSCPSTGPVCVVSW